MKGKRRKAYELLERVRHWPPTNRCLARLVRNSVILHPLVDTLLIVHVPRWVEERVGVGLNGVSEVERPYEGMAVSGIGIKKRKR